MGVVVPVVVETLPKLVKFYILVNLPAYHTEVFFVFSTQRGSMYLISVGMLLYLTPLPTHPPSWTPGSIWRREISVREFSGDLE